MKTPAKEKWLAMLRSGEFKQATNGRLCSIHELPSETITCYCALGVGALACGLEFDKYGRIEFDGLSYLGVLPVEAYESLGIGYGDVNAIIEFNDYQHWSLTQIADYIETKT